MLNWFRQQCLKSEYEMRTLWLRIERSGLEVHQANLEALRAWKEASPELQAKWTEELNQRLNAHAVLLQQWQSQYAAKAD